MTARPRRPVQWALVAVLLASMLSVLAGCSGQTTSKNAGPAYTGEARQLDATDLVGRGFSVLQGAGLLADPARTHDIETISALPPEAFERLDSPDLRKGFSSAAFWIRLDLEGQENMPAELLVVIWPPFIDRIDLYAPGPDGNFLRHRAGDHVPVSERMLATSETVLPMRLESSAQTWYLRVHSSSVISLSARIKDQASFIANSQRRANRQGLYMGMMLTAALIAGLATIWLRQPVFALATAYLFCYLGFQFTLNGYDQLKLYPEHPWIADNMLGAFAAGATALMLWFAISYLEPRRLMPRLTLLLHALAGLSLATAFIALSGHYALVAPMFLSLVAVAPLAMLALFVRMLAHTRERALAMLLMFAPVVAVTFAQALHNAGLFGAGEQISELWGIAAVAQMPVAAVAILLRVREVQRDLATESGYRSLIESQVDLVLRLNPWRQIEFASPSCLRLFGVNEDQVLGTSLLDHVHPDDSEQCERALAQVLEPPNTGYLEARMQSESGWRWLGWALSVSRDRRGRAHAVIAVGRDISARVAAEQELAESQRKLDLALQSGGIGFYELDLSTREVHVDERCLGILGYRPGEFELSWESWQALLHEDDLAALLPLVESSVFDQGQALDVEYRIRHRDGEWLWLFDRLIVADVDEHGRTTRMVGLLQDITRRKQTELRMDYLVQHDELTGLLNRRGISGVAQRQHSLCQREQRPCAFAMADLDHFKRVNDELGHEAGDEVLRQVGKLLRDNLRQGDWVGRWGGEEFLLVMPLCDLPEATLGLERIRQAVAASPLMVEGRQVPITISMGVTISQVGEQDLDEIVNRADRALYQAKADGRDRICARLP